MHFLIVTHLFLCLFSHSIYSQVEKLKSFKTQYADFNGPFFEDDFELSYFDHFMSNRDVPNDIAASNQFGVESVNPFLVNLTQISRMCPRKAFFSSFNPNHSAAVDLLADIFTAQAVGTEGGDIVRSFLNLNLKTNENVHPKVWYGALIQAQLRRAPETLSTRRPNPIYLFPTSFFPNSVLQRPSNEPQCLVLDERFGQDNGIENNLWYFREDVSLNAHHWIWHLRYPFNRADLAVDRRGEAFAFFHHDIMARYAAERLSNGLEPQTAFNIGLDSVAEEGYIPHLTDGISSINYATRPPNQRLSTVLNNTAFTRILTDLTTTKFRVFEGILAGQLVNTNGSFTPIHSSDNINLLGDISEASVNSFNPMFYGNIGYHNLGHIIISNLIGNSTPLSTFGVMADSTTAMRDPLFYRWHQLVDNIFTAYKLTHLPPYQLNQGAHRLVFDNIIATGVRVIPDESQNRRINNLMTYWNTSRFDLQGGLDFNVSDSATNVSICAKHLDHEEFSYQIFIENRRRIEVPSTIKIFMAPRFKSLRTRERFSMSEQRNIFFAMDSFATILNPGQNVVTRRSLDSTLTAPWPKSPTQLRLEILNNNTERINCECGFPHHLLLPKGSEDGMTFDLFVMVSEGYLDSNLENSSSTNGGQQEKCIPSHIHCGIQGESYPDSKPMGYPFDRRPFEVPTLVRNEYGRVSGVQNETVASLEEYVDQIPNAITTQVVITHRNEQYGLDPRFIWS